MARIVPVVFGVTGLLCAIAGAIYAVNYGQVSQSMGDDVGVKAIAGMVIGGLGSIWGAVAGGLVVGLAEALSIQYLGTDSVTAVVWGLLLAVLLLWRKGCLAAAADGPSCERLPGWPVVVAVHSDHLRLRRVPARGVRPTEPGWRRVAGDGRLHRRAAERAIGRAAMADAACRDAGGWRPCRRHRHPGAAHPWRLHGAGDHGLQRVDRRPAGGDALVRRRPPASPFRSSWDWPGWCRWPSWRLCSWRR